MKINNITVIGGGIMGRQIALNAAIHGFGAAVYDVAKPVLDAVDAWEEEYLAGRIAKGKMTAEQVADVKKLFRTDADLASALKGADAVIEAVVEKEDVKKAVFRQICEIADENVIIATNSSYMVSSKFTDAVTNPSRLANCHFYNPALVLKFVEVVQGAHTSEETAKALYDFCLACGKTPIWMKKEISGFAANYLLEGIQDRARALVAGGYCTPQDVDLAAENGLNYPMGPFRLMDLTGIDLKYDILNNRYNGEDYDMKDIFAQMVKENKLGRKTGEGFYKYDK